jgi:hypothetical protein
VFAVFLAGIMEFGHAYLVINTLQASAKSAARIGALDDRTTSDVRDEANRILGSAFDKTQAVIEIKDASVFDESTVDADSIDYGALPEVEVGDLDPGDLFIVRIRVPYNNVALLPPFWAKDLTLSAQSVMRHE